MNSGPRSKNWAAQNSRIGPTDASIVMDNNLIDSNENSHDKSMTNEVHDKLAANNNNNNNNDPPAVLHAPSLSPSPKIAIPAGSAAASHNNACLNCPNGSSTTSDHEDDYPASPAFHNDRLIEEIFQLPHCVSDDEGSSNSDNCVYAYRGGGNNGLDLLPQVILRAYFYS